MYSEFSSSCGNFSYTSERSLYADHARTGSDVGLWFSILHKKLPWAFKKTKYSGKYTQFVSTLKYRMKETKWLGGGLRRKGAEELRCAAEVKVNAISRESWVPLNSQEAIVSKRLGYV
jgi:hypothetical protein